MASILLITVTATEYRATRLKTELETLGHTVTVVEQAALSGASTAGVDLIAIAALTDEGIGGPGLPHQQWIADRWGEGIPLLFGAAWNATSASYSTMSRLGLGVAVYNFGSTVGTTTSLTVLTSHPVVAGFTGTVAVRTAADSTCPSTTAGGVVSVASVTGRSEILFKVIDKGAACATGGNATLSPGTAPARAAHAGWLPFATSALTADGRTILRQTIAWLAPDASGPVAHPAEATLDTAATVTAEPTRTPVQRPAEVTVDTGVEIVAEPDTVTPGIGHAAETSIDTGTDVTAEPAAAHTAEATLDAGVQIVAEAKASGEGVELAAIGLAIGLDATSRTISLTHSTASIGLTLGLDATNRTVAHAGPAAFALTFGLRIKQTRDWGEGVRTGRPTYRVRITTRDGTNVLELDKPVIAPLETGRNLIDMFTFALLRTNRKGKRIRPGVHQAQLWRGNVFLTKGDIGPGVAVGASMQWTVKRPDAILREGRVIGRIPKRQLLRNSGFTQGLDGLSFWKGGWGPESALKAAPTARVIDDPLSASGKALVLGAVDKVVTKKVDLESPAVFEPNRATYLKGGEDKIRAVGKDIPEGSTVRITGFTADDGTGDGLKLSLKRAQAAKATLAAMDKGLKFALPVGLKGPNLNDGTVAGRGYYEPIATNKTEAGRRKNRRVSIAYEGVQTATGHAQYYYQRLTVTQPTSAKVPLPITLAGDMQILRWDGAPADGWALRLMILDIVATKETVETSAVFAPNSATYLSGGEAKVETIGKKIPEGATVNLVGHTADNRINGDAGNGLDLSLNRAKAVRATLQGLGRKLTFKLPALWSEIKANQRKDDGSVGGRGYYDPVGPNRTETQQAKNRRVEIYYTAQTVLVEGADSSATMDELTPRVKWAHYETSVELPADGKPRTIEARLYPPAGESIWRDVGLWPEDQIGLYNVDQALHVKAWVEHAQDVEMGHGDLGIGTRTPKTGMLRTVERRFSERMPVGTQLDWYTSIAHGLDIDCEVTPTRATIVTHFPRQGSPSGLTIVHGGSKAGQTALRVIAYKPLSASPRDLASSIIMQADGSGAARPEAYARDAKALGGTLVESVVSAEGETPLGELQEAADVTLGQSLHPRPGWEVTIDATQTTRLLDSLGKGDTTRLILPDEAVDALHRLERMRLDPASDTATLTLVEA